jgi:hypothetical protein
VCNVKNEKLSELPCRYRIFVSQRRMATSLSKNS